jgi:hypothetical protein
MFKMLIQAPQIRTVVASDNFILLSVPVPR